MDRYDFRKIFTWMPWLTLIILGGWAGLFVIDILEPCQRDIGVLTVFIGIVFFTFAVDSLMKENPEFVRKYFIEWILVCGLFIFFALSIYIWYL
ncbi:MAG: hypothetical protein ACTSYB_14925 [Candidatus Helarchaeota archaeon]